MVVSLEALDGQTLHYLIIFSEVGQKGRHGRVPFPSLIVDSHHIVDFSIIEQKWCPIRLFDMV
jgi:hypothetical protein